MADDTEGERTERIKAEFIKARSPRPDGREWPTCATYPNLACVCRGAINGSNRSEATCTRKRTGDLSPIPTAAQLQERARIAREEASRG